jgi:hypothetical protein
MQNSAPFQARASFRSPSWHPIRIPAVSASSGRAVLPSRYEFPEACYRCCRCCLVWRFPAGVMHDLTVEFGQEDPVSLRTHIEHAF